MASEQGKKVEIENLLTESPAWYQVQVMEHNI